MGDIEDIHWKYIFGKKKKKKLAYSVIGHLKRGIEVY